jgi:hypothetical protein
MLKDFLPIAAWFGYAMLILTTILFTSYSFFIISDNIKRKLKR